MICKIHPDVSWNAIGPCPLCADEELKQLHVRYRRVINCVIAVREGWRVRVDSNNESAKALGEKGFYEQAISCQKDNSLIRSFINELDALLAQHDNLPHRDP